MKKLVSLLIAIVLLSSALAGCQMEWINETLGVENEPAAEPVSDELRLEIIEDYLVWSGIQSDKTLDEIKCEFYGKYGDSVAVYFHTAGAYETPVEEEIAGVKFSYPDSRVIRIWNDGKIYKMSKAYEMNLIDTGDVKTIKKTFGYLKYTRPYFIYQPKSLFDYEAHQSILDEWEATVETGVVEVCLDRGISTIGKKFDYDFFSSLDYDYIYDASSYKDYIPDNLPDIAVENYSHQFTIYLNDDSEQGVFDAIAILEEIDGVRWARPNYIVKRVDYQVTSNDEYYKDANNLSFTQMISGL